MPARCRRYDFFAASQHLRGVLRQKLAYDFFAASQHLRGVLRQKLAKLVPRLKSSVRFSGRLRFKTKGTRLTRFPPEIVFAR